MSGLDTSQAVTDEVSLNSEKYHAHSRPPADAPTGPAAQPEHEVEATPSQEAGTGG